MKKPTKQPQPQLPTVKPLTPKQLENVVGGNIPKQGSSSGDPDV